MEDIIPKSIPIREELETVQAFASHLPTDAWTSCRLETLNRPTAPVLVLVFKK
ncbi:hypothetical protein QJS04_geneDACA022177 [Acorus gramineus]|uniref:Uncharacterized protein n=1 Tax=Acorus gramineus TaxID=55184 RepID=A0AAV9BQM6_ACOGR|nr:hypothetical protein QJS04_geneDACA022177 [Acorus gramineus]